MKNCFTLLLFLFTFSLSAQVLFEQDFENGMAPMTLVDNDGLTPAPNVANFADAWTVSNNANLSNGTNVAVSNSWYNPAGQADDWMITPAISGISATTILRWEAKAQDPDYPDGYSVLISTAGTELGDFTDEVFSVGSEMTEFQERGVSLAAYEGQTIYIAFRNNSTDQYLLVVDNILVTNAASWDMQVSALSTNKFATTGNDVSITGEVKNVGTQEINAFTLSWTDGTNNYEQTIDNVSIPSFGTYSFTHETPLSVTEAIPYNYTVTVSNPNGNEDANLEDNSADGLVSGLAFIPSRRVVVEEGTGTWCGWCPRGAVALEYMEDNHAETFIGIAVHNGNNDPMVVSEYDSGLGFQGFPSSHVDRTVLGTNPESSILESIHNQRLQDITPVELDQEITYDANTRQITATVNTTFAATTSGDFRVSLVITEDGVTGTTSGYNQVNYYAGGGNGPMGGYENLPDPVPAADMVYDHVARALLGGFNGVAGSIPADVTANNTYDYTFEYTLPANMDPSNINIVALILDNDNGQILNGHKVHLSDVAVNTVEEVAPNFAINVFPNPLIESTSIELELDQAYDVNLVVTNSLGQKVAQRNYGQLSGKTLLPFNRGNLQAGIYYLNITIGTESITKRIVIQN
jgi:hypothetical protein